MNHSEKARSEFNRYQREWRARNKDRVKAINKRYWEKRAAKREEEMWNEQPDSN